MLLRQAQDRPFDTALLRSSLFFIADNPLLRDTSATFKSGIPDEQHRKTG